MVKTTGPRIPRPFVQPEDPRSLKQREGTHNVCLDERGGTGDGPVHVGLCGEVHDGIDGMLTQQMLDERVIRDIAWYHGMTVRVGQFLQIL
jgi:hypothetical protein